MARWHERKGWHRAAAALGALAVQCVFAALFIWGLAVRHDPQDPRESLAAFSSSDVPPPPAPEPEPEPRDAAQGAPAPEGREGEALPREAPVPPVVIAPAPAAVTAGEGADTSDGSARQGAGSGAGGAGSGTGAGGSGDGSGGIATPARRIAGALRDSDYPRGAERQGLAGTVGISFRVRTDGRVDRCTVVRSSGHAMLDDLTCRLFTQRYRFRPAMTASGRAVESTLQTSFTWGTRRR